MTQQPRVFIVSLVLDVDVTTAVDIYSFGICALEARLAAQMTKCLECSTRSRFSPPLLRFSDGAFGNPRQRRVLLHLTGGPQQFHTVTGEPMSEGKMNGLCMSTALSTSHCMKLHVWAWKAPSCCEECVSHVCFCRSLSRNASNVIPAEGPRPESCSSTPLCSKCRCWSSWPHIVSSAISVSSCRKCYTCYREFGL